MKDITGQGGGAASLHIHTDSIYCMQNTTETQSITRYNRSLAWWGAPVIPAIWQAEAGGSQVQEFKSSLSNTAKSVY